MNAANVDIPLPLACYKKLIGAELTFADLETFRPSLARGLRQLLEWPEQNVEEIFCRTFRVLRRSLMVQLVRRLEL